MCDGMLWVSIYICLARAVAVAVDVCDEDQVKNVFKVAMDTYGKVDICVCNAAILIADAVVDFDLNK